MLVVSLTAAAQDRIIIDLRCCWELRRYRLGIGHVKRLEDDLGFGRFFDGLNILKALQGLHQVLLLDLLHLPRLVKT